MNSDILWWLFLYVIPVCITFPAMLYVFSLEHQPCQVITCRTILRSATFGSYITALLMGLFPGVNFLLAVFFLLFNLYLSFDTHLFRLWHWQPFKKKE